MNKLPATLMFCESKWLGFACATRTTLMPDFEVNGGFFKLFLKALSFGEGWVRLLPTAEQLRPKSGKTIGACALEGHSKFFAAASGRAALGQYFAAPVLPDLHGKGQSAAKKPFC